MEITECAPLGRRISFQVTIVDAVDLINEFLQNAGVKIYFSIPLGALQGHTGEQG